jgi:hypothetical protein
VPDCRLGGACPNNLTCASNGICKPGSDAAADAPFDAPKDALPDAPADAPKDAPPDAPPPDGGVDSGVDSGVDAGITSYEAKLAVPAGRSWFSNTFEGNNVGISGTTIAVGNAGGLSSAGEVNVFTYVNGAWTLQQNLPGASGAGFGISVDVDGDRMIVGALWAMQIMTEVGKAYVYARSGSTWTLEKELGSANPDYTDGFGQAVAISGTTVAVGSSHDNNTPTGTVGHAGSVTIFTRTMNGGWPTQATINPTGSAAYDNYGWSVALSGSTLVAGAPSVDGTGNGRAFVHTRSGTTWSQQAELTASDGAPSDRFGFSVAISSTTIIVGAPLHDAQGDASGAAYVFVNNAGVWTQQAKLMASDGVASAKFGNSVAAVSADEVLVGAGGAGKIYVFQRSGGVWTQTATHTACNATTGASLDTSGNLFVASGGGSAWVFDLNDPVTTCVGP